MQISSGTSEELNNLPLASALQPKPKSRMRWVILALVFFAITINYVDRMVIGILAPDLRAEFHISNQAYGWITAAFALSYAIGQAISGRWLDWIGTRSGYAIALASWSVASMVHALARTTVGFGLARGLLGFTESPAYPAAAKTIAEWFPKKERALAMGFANAGANLGAVLAPWVVPMLALNYGWQSAFIVTGAFGLIWLAFWIPLYRRPHEHPRVSPEELAYINSDPADPQAGPLRLLPLNVAQKSWMGATAAVFGFAMGYFIGRELGGVYVALIAAVVAGGFAALACTRPWARLLTYRQAWAFLLGKFLTDPIWSFYLFWLPTFFSDRHGIDLKTVGPPMIAIYLMADVGSIGGGWMSSSMIKRGWSINAARKATLFVCAVLIVPSIFVSSVPSVWAAVMLAGLALAAHQGYSANLYTVASDMFPKRAVGSATGLGGTFGYLGTSLFMPFVGWVLDNTKSDAYPKGNYLPIFLIAGSAYLVGFFLIHFLVPRLEPVKLDEVERTA